VEVEKQRSYNEKIAAILGAKDSLKADTKSLRLDYHETINKNMKSQKEELTEVLKGIEEDTRRLRKS